jgi:NIPSNAP
MIVEQRTYTLRAGAVAEYLKVYEQEGLHVQKEHLPRMMGYYFSEIGDLNQIIHMWAYNDLKHREECRAALFNDERWRIVVKKLYTFIERMENKILVPTRFSPGWSEASR